LIFVIVVAAMAPVAVYLDARINVADLIALLVALIPTTIGALLSAIGIAGIDRTMRFNVLAMSGKAIEAAGDVHTLILDKTGTISVATGRRPSSYLWKASEPASSLKRPISLPSSIPRPKDGRSSPSPKSRAPIARICRIGHDRWISRRRRA